MPDLLGGARAPLEHAQPRYHRIQWRPELVGEHGQEIALGLVRILGCFPTAAVRVPGLRPLNRSGDAVAGQMQELNLVVFEAPLSEAADVQHAGQAPLRLERYAGEGLDAFFPDPRAVHPIVVHLLEHDCLPLVGDRAREALADRDADLAPDLLLESDRRAGSEEVRRAARILLAKQDGGGVDVETLLNAEEEFMQQRIERKIDER